MVDIKIANATFKDVETVELFSPSGEAFSFDLRNHSVPFEYGGLNAIKIAEYDESWILGDTSFVVGSSSSTTSTSILASVSNKYTTPLSPTYSYGDKDIVVVQRCLAKPTYNSSVSKKAQQIQYAATYVSWMSKRKTTDTSQKTTRQVYNSSAYINQYYNSSSAITRAVANYGFYMTPSAPTVASATSASTYVRCSTPVLYYRVSSTYMSSANIKTVTDCNFYWHLDVYAVDPFSTITSTINDDLDRILTNGGL